MLDRNGLSQILELFAAGRRFDLAVGGQVEAGGQAGARGRFARHLGDSEGLEGVALGRGAGFERGKRARRDHHQAGLVA